MKMVIRTLVALITFGAGLLINGLWISVTNALTFTSETPVPAISLRAEADDERYAVLSAVIRELYVEQDTSLVVIQNEDACPDADQELAEIPQNQEESENSAFAALDGLKAETIKNFHQNLGRCDRLQRKLSIPVQYVLVNRTELDQMFTSVGRGWSQFYRKYPESSGILSFSYVGFDSEGQQALVGTSRGCGGLCGSGGLVLLTKVDGSWRVKKHVVTWVS